MKKQFVQIRGDEILHLSYNQRVEEIERLNKHVDTQVAQIAQLREALEPFASIYAELKTGEHIVIVGKDRKQVIVSLEWFALAARALKGGE